jgi:hypothetical protein
MAKATSMSVDEKRWRTESDLRTLVEAAAIKRDPARLKAAQTLAKSKQAEMTAEAQAMKTLAAGKTPG